MKPVDREDPFKDLEPTRPNGKPKLVHSVDDDRWPPAEAYHNEFVEPVTDIQPLKATPFVWRDPLDIPPRPWVYGRHMIRKQVSVTVAPGGVGKSSLAILEALCLASGRQILGEWVPEEPLRVWIYNLEDPREEMERRIIAAMMHHNITPDDIGDRLYFDTGRERGLCTAIEVRGEVTIVKPEIEALAMEIETRAIDVFMADPFISTHRVSENASGAIDMVAKEWARLSDRCNCAVELAHHTRKTGGAEATSEDGRGSSALLGAARSGRVLNKMSKEMKENCGIHEDEMIFGIDRDKANLAPAGARKWIRMVSVDLGQGDYVGVAECWQMPDDFDGVSRADLLAIQQQIHKRHDEGRPPRFSDQAGYDWVGHIVAEFTDMDAEDDAKKIKRMINTWIKNGALVKVQIEDKKRMKRPCVDVGEWAWD